jgi:ABC transporter DrrB family efflux protein
VSTASVAIPARDWQDRRIPLGVIRDTLEITRRNLIGYVRVPQLLIFSTIQPVIFVLLFRYAFGGAVSLPGFRYPYVDYLMPGIFIQTVVFGSITTAIGMATDLKSGLTERFRALPMSRSAVLAGRTLADLARNVFVVLLMMAVGFAVGWRVHTGFGALVCGALLVLLFGYAMSWVFAAVGLAVGDPESAQAASFPVLAPLVFASGAFVPVSSMPGWLQAFADHQPVSIAAAAVRALMVGGPTATDVWHSIAWNLGILVVFAPLAVRLYRRAV